MTHPELPIQGDEGVQQNDDEGTPEIRRLAQNVSVETQLWQWEQDATHLVVNVFQVNVQLLPSGTLKKKREKKKRRFLQTKQKHFENKHMT